MACCWPTAASEFRRALASLIAAAALAACAAVFIYCLGAALYLLFLPSLGPAGAAAGLALVLAALLGLAAGVAAVALAPRRVRERTRPLAPAGLDRVVAFVRARPVTAVSAAALTAGLAAVSPRLLLLTVRLLLARRARA